MQLPSTSQLIPLLQTSIGPVILISGIGMILLTMTNRLGLTVTRIRNLNDNLDKATGAGRTKILRETQILMRRVRLIRLAILLAATSVLLVSMLIMMLFFMILLEVEIAWLIAVMFIIAMASLISSLIIFTYDVNQSLTALTFELLHNEPLDRSTNDKDAYSTDKV